MRPPLFSPHLPCCCFNPRTHTGATEATSEKARALMFQSTHPYGCDSVSRRDVLDVLVSIHAPIRVRPVLCLFRVSCRRFNPRTHTGATWECPASSIRASFNPRTHTGATTIKNGNGMAWKFQSTHPYGCDDLPRMQFQRPYSFNPRTHTGATRVVVDVDAVGRVSIHAPIRVRLLLRSGQS